jgi:predicted Ser/Thr protein kinase
MRNPAFTNLLAEMQALHESKNSDYASDVDPYSNFRQAAAVAEGFSGVDAVFATMIGVKLARLRELTSSGKQPNHESVQDTRTDLAMYATLWASFWR